MTLTLKQIALSIIAGISLLALPACEKKEVIWRGDIDGNYTELEGTFRGEYLRDYHLTIYTDTNNIKYVDWGANLVPNVFPENIDRLEAIHLYQGTMGKIRQERSKTRKKDVGSVIKLKFKNEFGLPKEFELPIITR